MSLAEETARVAGGGKNTLKTILQKLGVGVGAERIDQYPTLANQISGKLHPDNLISSSTATSLGLAGTATPNEAFAKIKALIDSVNTGLNARAKIASGSYVGTGTGGQSNPTSITVGFSPKVVIVGNTNPSNSSYWFLIMMNPLGHAVEGLPEFSSNSKCVFVSWTGSGVSWYAESNFNPQYPQLNDAGITYQWIAWG